MNNTFYYSIGMVIHGRLKADGERASTPITFTLYENMDEVALENRTSTVRLVDGLDEYEGRVEVKMFDEWGVVCADVSHWFRKI